MHAKLPVRSLPVLASLTSLATLTACAAPAPRAPSADNRAYAAALVRMCDVDREAGLTPESDLLGVGVKRSAWIAEHVDNPDAIELRTYMSVRGAPEQGVMLRDAAKDLGIPRCALAESLLSLCEGGISP